MFSVPNKPGLTKSLLQLILCLTCAVAGAFNVRAQQDESRTDAQKAGLLSGRVVNENGEAVSHAAVYISSAGLLLQPRITSTDDRGNFSVSGLDQSLFTVGVAAPTYIQTPRAPDSQPNYYRIGDTVTISLLKGGVMTGTVTTATGEPMVQAAVKAVLIRDAFGEPSSGSRFQIEKLTDDRGVYRIYGLASGTYLVSAAGRSYGFFGNAYEGAAPTFAPSSTRDAAAEIVVRAGEEVAGVDIRYRGEPGHVISGVVSGPMGTDSGPTVSLRSIVNSAPQGATMGAQDYNSKGFAFYGVADGDYDLMAQSYLGEGELAASERLRVTVKGGDVPGIKLVLKGLAAIKGHIALENSAAPECKNKRKPLFSETLFTVRREKTSTKEDLPIPSVFVQSVPNAAGDFALRNLGAGQFSSNLRFFAKYWYVRSITREVSGVPVARSSLVNRQSDVARLGIDLKFGERVSGLTVTLAEGAASIRGAIKLTADEPLPARLFVNLVPAEKENAEDVLRFFTVPVNSDATFAINNVPPGQYRVLARIVGEGEPKSDFDLRAPIAGTELRAQLRRAAEAIKTSVELKPCQNVSNYELSLKINSAKN